MKFSAFAQNHLSERLVKSRGDFFARNSVEYLGPAIRALLLKIAAGERVPPEYVLTFLAGCLKVGSVLAEVKTMPSKDKGLPIQSSDIIRGEPGIGKGQSFQCRDDLLDNVKGMLMDYANEEMTLSKLPVHGPLNDGERGPFVKHSNTF